MRPQSESQPTVLTSEVYHFLPSCNTGVLTGLLITWTSCICRLFSPSRHELLWVDTVLVTRCAILYQSQPEAEVGVATFGPIGQQPMDYISDSFGADRRREPKRTLRSRSPVLLRGVGHVPLAQRHAVVFTCPVSSSLRSLLVGCDKAISS